MTDVSLVKFKIKEGQKEAWLKWCEELKRRKSEVLQTLGNEGVIAEACFLSDDEESVYYFVEALNLETAHSIYRRSTLPIDKEHKVTTDSTLQRVGQMRVLFHFHLSK